MDSEEAIEKIKKHETDKGNVYEKLEDVLSLIILLENDFATQGADELYKRAMRMIHQLIVSIQKELKGDEKPSYKC